MSEALQFNKGDRVKMNLPEHHVSPVLLVNRVSQSKSGDGGTMYQCIFWSEKTDMYMPVDVHHKCLIKVED